jgi:hypothetical protein
MVLQRIRPYTARVLAGLVVLALVGARVVVSRNARHDAAVAEGRRLLLEGDFAGAAAEFTAVEDSSRVGAEARAGLVVARTASGDARADISASDAKATVDTLGVPLRPLLDGAMLGRRYDAARDLARLAADGGETWARAYQAAALVDLGRDDDARALVAAHPDVFATPGAGAAVAEVLALRAGGAVVIVRDRAGRLLGGVSESGQFRPLPDVPKEWVPALALRDLRPGALAGARLTIDLPLSRTAAESLASRRGTIVLIDPATGAVKVALSDAATLAAEGGTPAFDQQREPASIQKIITSTATLRAGLDPDAEIARMTCTGSQRYGSGSLWCAYPGGKLGGLGHAMGISCNVAFANLGARIGRAAVVGELRRYGFDAESPGAGRVLHPEGDARQLADLSVGLESTQISPAHAARMAAVFAGDGVMPGVFLVAAEDGAMGMSPRPRPAPEPQRVLDPAWVAVMRKAMAPVTAPGGTAEGVAPAGFPVAMKTGTAATPNQGYHVNYIGVGPLPDPSVAFCVRVTNLGSSSTVNVAAREVLSALLGRLAQGRATAP